MYFSFAFDRIPFWMGYALYAPGLFPGQEGPDGIYQRRWNNAVDVDRADLDTGDNILHCTVEKGAMVKILPRTACPQKTIRREDYAHGMVMGLRKWRHHNIGVEQVYANIQMCIAPDDYQRAAFVPGETIWRLDRLGVREYIMTNESRIVPISGIDGFSEVRPFIDENAGSMPLMSTGSYYVRPEFVFHTTTNHGECSYVLNKLSEMGTMSMCTGKCQREAVYRPSTDTLRYCAKEGCNEWFHIDCLVRAEYVEGYLRSPGPLTAAQLSDGKLVWARIISVPIQRMVCSRSPISFEKLLMRARRMPNMENGLTLSPTELNEWIIAMLDLCKGPHDSKFVAEALDWFKDYAFFFYHDYYSCPNCFAEI